ncbi:MAG: hypothetical protein ABIR36_04755 [Nitrospiraceae bacterium]
MKLRLIPALLVFISSYFPLAAIFIVKDLNGDTFYPQHPKLAAIIAIITLASCIFVLVAARTIKSGVQVRITKVASRSGEMFTYTVPYMIAFYNFTLGDWKTLLSLMIFMGIMFSLSYKTQNMFVNPVLALAGYGLYECHFKDGDREIQGQLISECPFQIGDVCVVERLSYFLYFVSKVEITEDQHAG